MCNSERLCIVPEGAEECRVACPPVSQALQAAAAAVCSHGCRERHSSSGAASSYARKAMRRGFCGSGQCAPGGAAVRTMGISARRKGKRDVKKWSGEICTSTYNFHSDILFHVFFWSCYLGSVTHGFWDTCRPLYNSRWGEGSPIEDCDQWNVFFFKKNIM